jgi:hypothetical protein
LRTSENTYLPRASVKEKGRLLSASRYLIGH